MMRDFPLFTTENGVGSLVLREIPYRGIAYITILDSSIPTEFLSECLDFCRVAGAKTVYASGHNCLEAYPFYTSVICMSARLSSIALSDAALFPVTEKTAQRWREIYNTRMKEVDNASYMSRKDMEQMLQRGDGYFVHRDGDLLGIGVASGERIDCVASFKPGSGREVVKALCHALQTECVTLEVASTNHRAISLYESLGFIKTRERSKWYKIL